MHAQGHSPVAQHRQKNEAKLNINDECGKQRTGQLHFKDNTIQYPMQSRKVTSLPNTVTNHHRQRNRTDRMAGQPSISKYIPYETYLLFGFIG